MKGRLDGWLLGWVDVCEGNWPEAWLVNSGEGCVVGWTGGCELGWPKGLLDA